MSKWFLDEINTYIDTYIDHDLDEEMSGHLVHWSPDVEEPDSSETEDITEEQIQWIKDNVDSDIHKGIVKRQIEWIRNVKDWYTSDSKDTTRDEIKWVRDAKTLHASGVVIEFDNTITINVNAGFSPNNLPDFTTQVTGTTKILFGKPKDAIVGDPLLGNVGRINRKYDVSRTELVSSSSVGVTPFSPQLIVRAGDGTGDLAPTPADADLPYESLHSAGAVVKQSNRSAAAKTFFELFLEIEDAPNGVIRNKTPVTVEGKLSPKNSFSDGQVQLNYTSSAITPLYNAGADGVFWTGDEIEVARLVPGANGNALTINLTSSLW